MSMSNTVPCLPVTKMRHGPIFGLRIQQCEELVRPEPAFFTGAFNEEIDSLASCCLGCHLGGGRSLCSRSNFGPDVPHRFGETGERKRYGIYHLRDSFHN